MNIQKIKRLESISQELVSDFFTEYVTSELNSDHWLINISWIKISSDLSYMDIFVSSFKNNNKLPKSLTNYTKELQRFINKKLEIRKLPRVRFRYDNKWEISSNICEIINKIS